MPVKTTSDNFWRRVRRSRRGAIFITALGIIVILAGLVLVLAQEMRTEAVTSANRLSYAEADAVERGAEQWVLSQVDSYPGDALTITQTPAAALQIGNGYFWVMHPDATIDTQYDFGITDEASKLNVNQANVARLSLLPGLTEEQAASIHNWRSTNANPDGAESDYYESLAEPYQCKNAAYETVEEMLLVKDITPAVMWGADVNRNGVIDANESASLGTTSLFSNSGGGSRGIFPYVTCYSIDPNAGNKVNINSATNMSTLLQQKLGASRGAAIMQTLGSFYRQAARGGGVAFTSLGQFYTASGMTTTELSEVFDRITRAKGPRTGLVNLNTATVPVLMCLGLSQSDASALVPQQASATSTDHSWAFKAISPAGLSAILGAVTFESYQYSADIVAVSEDGRSFKRVRIVVDGTTPPAKIIFREDLTSLGWPLTDALRVSMRAGKGITADMQGTGVGTPGLTIK